MLRKKSCFLISDGSMLVLFLYKAYFCVTNGSGYSSFWISDQKSIEMIPFHSAGKAKYILEAIEAKQRPLSDVTVISFK